MKIMVYEARPDERADLEKQAAPHGVELSVTDAVPTLENASLAAGCIGVSILGQGCIDAALLDAYHALGIRYLSTRTIGYDHIALDHARSIGLRVCSASYAPNGVADFTVMMILMCLRHYKQALWRGQVNDFSLTGLQGREMKDLTIGIIGAADGPTSILVSQTLGSNYIGAIAVAAYSYMALVPIIQPFAIKLVTTKKDRAMRMPYRAQGVSKRLRIMFPIVVSVIAGLVAPSSVALVGFLMFGNLIRECGVLTSLSQTAQNELANLITLLLGITIAASMKADQFVRWETLMIMGLGLVAFILDSMVGVIFVKILNIFTPKNKINPMVGAAGISAFPMSSRVIEKMGQEADSQNHLLMHAVAANVSGQIASVVAGGVVLQYFANNPIL